MSKRLETFSHIEPPISDSIWPCFKRWKRIIHTLQQQSLLPNVRVGCQCRLLLLRLPMAEDCGLSNIDKVPVFVSYRILGAMSGNTMSPISLTLACACHPAKYHRRFHIVIGCVEGVPPLDSRNARWPNARGEQ